MYKDLKFLSTPSARRATRSRDKRGFGTKNFYPRPPRGGRQPLPLSLLGAIIFLSTPSARRATTGENVTIVAHKDFYPRPPRGGRRSTSRRMQGHRKDFYPRPPRGGRPSHSADTFPSLKFLSTPSARRATIMQGLNLIQGKNISIHALREEGDEQGGQ